MTSPSRRQVLAVRIGVAHLFGLLIVGFYGTVGTSGGFGAGAFFGMFAGAIFSLPWIAAVLAIVWFRGNALDRYIIPFCILGPIVICGSWWALSGASLLDVVALSCITSSVWVLALTLFERRKMIAD
ncbi:hypothetical protein [Sphingopyxis fribergensis]|uniref:hypothetical protein n=1 Tax=Sphingopyxis fribergensis TaxID=1515612 RepID=UPI0011DDCD28|nr:hypothetical protein [Sphingopyxis fribergensis]